MILGVGSSTTVLLPSIAEQEITALKRWSSTDSLGDDDPPRGEGASRVCEVDAKPTFCESHRHIIQYTTQRHTL